jgi:hypothetical protein
MVKTVAAGLTALFVTASFASLRTGSFRHYYYWRRAGECEAKRSRLERSDRRANWHSQGGIAAHA